MMVAAAPPPQTEFILHKLQYKCLQRFFNRRYSSDAISANDHHFYSPAKKVKMHSKKPHSRNGNAFLNSQRFSVEKSSESLL